MKSEEPVRLLVFNGDCALDAFRKVGSPIEGELLAWKEVYTEGPLPCDVSLEEFRRVRASFLANGVAPREFTAARLENHLRKMEETLFVCWEKQKEVTLFLDPCMFDCGIFARILFLAEDFRKRRGIFPYVSFGCLDGVVYSKDSPFGELFAGRVKVEKLLLDMAGFLWECYAKCLVPEESILKKLPPFFAEGLIRRGAENPEADEKYHLSRTERELLFILKKRGTEGISPIDLFFALDEYEEFPFLGDTGCWRLLESLRKRGYILSSCPHSVASFTEEQLKSPVLFPGEKLFSMEF